MCKRITMAKKSTIIERADSIIANGTNREKAQLWAENRARNMLLEKENVLPKEQSDALVHSLLSTTRGQKEIAKWRDYIEGLFTIYNLLRLLTSDTEQKVSLLKWKFRESYYVKAQIGVRNMIGPITIDGKDVSEELAYITIGDKQYKAERGKDGKYRMEAEKIFKLLGTEQAIIDVYNYAGTALSCITGYEAYMRYYGIVPTLQSRIKLLKERVEGMLANCVPEVYRCCLGWGDREECLKRCDIWESIDVPDLTDLKPVRRIATQYIANCFKQTPTEIEKIFKFFDDKNIWQIESEE